MDNARFHDELRRYWDEIARGGPATSGDLDPELAAAIRRLHALPDVPPPDTSYANRLWESLMHATTLPFDPLAPGANGRSTPPTRRSITPPRPAAPGRWVLAQLATAALLLLTLIGSFLVFGPGRQGPQEAAPLFLPAISGTPATPERVAEPVVEFLWQLAKVPDRHFIELGRPAIDPAGNLWVPDAAFGQYHILAPDGTFLETWGASGTGEGEFDLACEDIPYGGIAFAASGGFYVVDSGNHRIQKFGPDRAFLTSWGSEGVADDEFICPAAIAIDQQDRVYVSDRGQNKIVVFDRDGAWLDTWSTPPAPTGLAVDWENNIWVAAYDSGSVVQFSPDGDVLTTWNTSASEKRTLLGPNNVAVDAQGRVFVTEHDGNRVQVFAPDGTLLGAWGAVGSGPGEFNEPRGIALDGQGGAYVTEWAGNRVQKFRLLPPLD